MRRHGSSIARAATRAAVTALLAVTAAGADPRCYDPPVAAPIAERFREPACPYCAGRRGITFATRPGDTVRAVAPGVVTFSGRVAGTAYVVVAHDDGVLATYGRFARTWVTTGQRIRLQQAIATAGSSPLHFGLRQAGRYIDPEPLLGIRRFPVRLVPTERSTRRAAAGNGQLVCPLGQ